MSMSSTSGALSITPLKAPIPPKMTMTPKVSKDMNKTRKADTCARFSIMEDREVKALRFLEVDFFP